MSAPREVLAPGMAVHYWVRHYRADANVREMATVVAVDGDRVRVRRLRGGKFPEQWVRATRLRIGTPEDPRCACGAVPPTPSHRWCEACKPRRKAQNNTKAQRAYARRRWIRFRSVGGCGWCGVPSGRFALCLEHRLRMAADRKARVEKTRRQARRAA